MIVQPYLQFDGRCEEALDFYQAAVGAEVQMLMRHKESPQRPPPGTLPSGSDEKIMHVTFRIGDSVIMASDGMCGGKPVFNGITLSLTAADEAEAKSVFARLADGGEVRMPLGKTFWSPAFGMLIDRFGVSWMVQVPGQ